MLLFKFLKSRTFFLNIVLAVIAAILIYYALLIALSKYTEHGEKIEVPNMLGLTYNDALELANEKELKIVVSDTVFASEEARGLIAAQIPPASSEVKRERTVYLTINSLEAEKIAMPNFVGASLRQAMADAEIVGIKIGELTYVPDIAKNNVLEQKVDGEDITPGTRVEKGTFVDLTLGLGISNESAYVPLLLSKTVLESDSILQTKYLNSGAHFYDETIETLEDSVNAIVYQQNPEPLAKHIRPGEFVDLWLTLDSTKIIIKPEWVDSLNIDTTLFQYMNIDTLSQNE